MKHDARWRRGLAGAALAALGALILYVVTVRFESATLPRALVLRFLPIVAAALLGFLIVEPTTRNGSWSGRELAWVTGIGVGVGAVAYLLDANLVPRLSPLRVTGLPLLLSHGLAVIAPLVAFRAVPRVGSVTLGLTAALLARRILGGSPSAYPALELLQLPAIVLLAELFLATSRDRFRMEWRMAAAGALLGLGAVGTGWLLLPSSGLSADWPGELAAGVIAGAAAGWLVAKAPTPAAIRERLDRGGG